MKPLHEYLTDFGREPDRITAMINAMQKMERTIMGLALQVDRLERERDKMRDDFSKLTSEYWHRKG